MAKPTTAAQAMARLEELCARAEHCQSEMRDKLRTWGIPSGDAEKVIASLRQHKFVDDTRYARAYVHDKFSYQKWGRRKIAQGLMTKRISRDEISDALAEIDQEEYIETLTSLLKAKLRTDPSLLDTYEGRARLYRFALQRGFESQFISSVLKSLAN
ncbi:MAG: RecX family transcriptional regulator [Muribaculaceae bacterium]|nr:RecX family transcriptional regulator [Muribaculaceae bacterium]